MKKILNLITIGFLCLILIGCTDNKNSVKNNDYSDANLYNNNDKIGEIITTDITQFNAIKNSDKISLIYVGRPTCPACVQFYPTLEEVAKNYQLDFYYTNIDEWDEKDLDEVLFPTLSEVKYTPSIVILYQNKQIDIISGSNEESELINFLTSNNILSKNCSIDKSC